MKVLSALALICFLAPTYATAEGEVKETAQKAGHSIKQGAKKAKNRVQEAFCADSDLECKAKKAANRVDETAGKVGDKVDEKIN